MTHIQGIIFDLDGTLVSSSLNFKAIRHEIGCSENDDILTYLERLPAVEKQAAADTVYRHEMADAESSTWLPHARTFVDKCAEIGVPMAIVTRNSAMATAVKVKNNAIPIKHIITREMISPKPDPAALINIAAQFRLRTSDLMMVGDYKYDLQAGRNAKMATCLVNFEALPDFANLADYTFAHFGLLQSAFFARSLPK